MTMKTFRTAQIQAVRMAGDEGMLLRGYAARFNSYSKDLGGFKERIQPGAFSTAVKERADVRFLTNHNPDSVMGRTKNGTLKLREDSEGLYFEVLLPDTQQGRDLRTTIERGDMDQCSFAFTVDEGDDEWAEDVDERGNRFVARTLKRVNLFDVSAVTYPAYEDTNVNTFLGNVS